MQRGVVYGVLAGALWGMVFLVPRLLTDFSPLLLSAGRYAMYGVVSLAAAIALPQALADGSPFLQRNLIIFLAFSVILVTLVLQGLTLPPLIRALGVAGSDERPEELEARRTILQAAIDHLEQVKSKAEAAIAEIYSDLGQHYRSRLAALAEGDGDGDAGFDPHFHDRYTQLSRELLGVERQTAIQLRNRGRRDRPTLRQLLQPATVPKGGPLGKPGIKPLPVLPHTP